MAKIFKGVIHSLLPYNHYGFITPPWGNGDNEENIFFRLADTKGKKCYIPALADPEKREVKTSKKGVTAFIPLEPQILYYELEARKVGDAYQMVAKNLRDDRHVTETEKGEAELNLEKPNIESLIVSETKVDYTVTPDTIKTTEAKEEAEELHNKQVMPVDNADDDYEEDEVEEERDYDAEEIYDSYYN